MKKEPKIFDWLVTAYNKNDKVRGAIIISDRTEHEAEQEASAIPLVANAADWTMVKTEDEIKRFMKEFGTSQTKLKEIEGLRGDSCAVSEMLINFGYVWVDKFKKWVNKNNSNYDERDEVVLNFIRQKYC